MTFGYERNDLMNTVGLSGEDRLELGALILQASELIKIFIGKYLINVKGRVITRLVD